MSARVAWMAIASLGAALAGCSDEVAVHATSSGSGGNGGAAPACPEGTSWSSNETALATPRSVRALPSGELLLTGTFSGTLDLGGQPISSAAGFAFLARLDAAGQVSSIAQVDAELQDAAVDGSGDVILAAWGGHANFGDGSIGSPNANDLFLAKLDAQGALAWSRAYSMEPGSECYARIAVDGAGNVLLAASLTGTLDLGAGPIVAAKPHSDCVVAKLDASGNLLSSTQLVATEMCIPSAIDVDAAGNTIVTGSFAGSLTIGTTTLKAQNWAAFALKLGPAGDVSWSEAFPRTELTSLRSANDALYLTGDDRGANDGGGAFAAEGGSFVAALDAGGALTWSEVFPDLFPDSVAVAPDGGLVVSGFDANAKLIVRQLDASGAEGCSVTADVFTTLYPDASLVAVNAAGDALAVGAFSAGAYAGSGEAGFGVLALPR